MILECPSCASKFKIGKGAIPDAGRKVRCANCKTVWTATPDAVFEPKQYQKPYEAALAKATDDAPIDQPGDSAAQSDANDTANHDEEPPTAEAEPAAGSDDDTANEPELSDIMDQTQDFVASINKALNDPDIDIDAPQNDGFAEIDEDEFLARRRAEERRDSERAKLARRRRLVFAGWLILLSLISGILVTLLFFKDTATAIFPPVKQLYTSVESLDYRKQDWDIGETPLSPPITEAKTVLNAYIRETPQVEQANGTATLTVKGFLRNEGQRAATVPRVRLQMLDNVGRVLDSWEHEPKGSIITRTQELDFVSTRTPVPPGVARVVVTIIEGSKSTARAEVP